jgi:hypothetical protein
MTVADKGNMVSQFNYRGMGSGMVPPKGLYVTR